MTQDAGETGERVRNVWTQPANALTLAPRVALAAPPGQEVNGQKFPESPDFSTSDSTKLRGWIAQLHVVIPHKTGSLPNTHSQMWYIFHPRMGVATHQILPKVWQDGEMGRADLPAFIQHLKVAFGDPDRVATAPRLIHVIEPKNTEYSQYFAEYQVIVADLDWNP